ncbi:MAG: sigma-70 family RNA polymerase sigma factor [Planctomycetes bacterium]|nr:sigma-70 family RNA polymerase sigma factor [Planctomycetota bacterium]
MAAAREGKEQARDELFARFRAPLVAFLHARLPWSTRGLLDTDDLVQEALANAFAALPRFEDRGTGAFWRFLRQIGLNQVRQAIRSQNAAKRGTPEVLDETHRFSAPSAKGPGPLELLLAVEEFEAFESALAGLPERTRTALLLRFEVDLEYSEIAVECGFSTADAARVAIQRAIADVAKELARGRPEA